MKFHFKISPEEVIWSDFFRRETAGKKYVEEEANIANSNLHYRKRH